MNTHTYPQFNLPMSQFDVFHGMGFRVITVVDTTVPYGFFGLRRVVAQINQDA